MTIRLNLVLCVVMMQASLLLCSQGNPLATPQDFLVPADGKLPLIAFPVVPKDFLSWETGRYKESDARKEYKAAFQDCPRVPDRDLPSTKVKTACSLIAANIRWEARTQPQEILSRNYSRIVNQILFAAGMRACYLGDMRACLQLGEMLEMWENIPAARMAWKVCDQDWPADPCREHLKDTLNFSASQLADRDQADSVADRQRVEDYKEAQAAKKNDHSSALAILRGVDEGLQDTNRRLSESNAEQAQRNADQMQQAQALVDTNDARRAAASAASPSQTPQSTFRFGSTGNNGSGTHVTPDGGTAAPPIGAPSLPPATTTAVLTVCPASGFVPGVMKQNGDTAVGVPCTPGQPIGPTPTPVPSASAAGLTLAQPIDRCITQFYANDNLSFTNNCTSPVYVEWYIGGHSGSWTLGAGETTHSGYSGADVAAGGSRYYACPQNYSPVDASYNRINSAVSNYICRLF